MKWAVLSDVHGNLEAFRAVIQDLRTEGVQQVASLGDVVGYGANPNECLALLRELTEWVVAGNHDYGAVGLTEIEPFNPAAKAAILWTRENLSRDNIAYLRHIPLLHRRERTTLVHATPHQPQEWNYILTFPEAAEGFRELAGDLAFIGHSHVPLTIVQEAGGEVKVLPEEELSLQEGSRYIINVGSVGQPRDQNPRAAYGLFDEGSRSYLLKRVPYDIPEAQSKILKAGLPPFLAQRLSRGV